MVFVCNNDELVNQGEKYFWNYIMNDREFGKVKTRYKIARQKLVETERKIKNIESLSDKEFINIYLEFHEKYISFWDHGLVPEIANWGGEHILKENLKKIPGTEFWTVYEKLSAPSGQSFYQKEELDLLLIKKGGRDLKEHIKKYFWINNSYLDAIILDEKFFKKRLIEIKKSEVAEKIKKIKNYLSNSKKEKQAIVKKFALSKSTEKIANRLCYSIYWQDERKENIFVANHYIKLLLSELARRYNIPFSYLERAWCWEIPLLLKSKKIDVPEMKKRLKKQAGFMDSEHEKNIIIMDKKFDSQIKRRQWQRTWKS